MVHDPDGRIISSGDGLNLQSAVGSGPLRRRHIWAGLPQHIGKESDRRAEQLAIGEDDAEIFYGLIPEARAGRIATIKTARKRFSVRTMTKAARVSDRTLAAAASGRGLVADSTLIQIADAANRLQAGWERQTAEEIELLEWAFERSGIEGPYKFADRIGVDGSNLGRALRRGRRKVSAAVLEQIRIARASAPVDEAGFQFRFTPQS